MIRFLLSTSLGQCVLERGSHLTHLAVQLREIPTQAPQIASGRKVDQVPEPPAMSLDLAARADPRAGGKAEGRQEGIAAHSVLEPRGDDLLRLIEDTPEQWLTGHRRGDTQTMRLDSAADRRPRRQSGKGQANAGCA
jgi:hypothetical protein